MNTMELDPILKQALKLLHSASPDSAEKIRLSLDEIVKQKFGTNKMLINTLSKKNLAEENTFPGTALPTKRQKHSSETSRTSSLGKSTHHHSDSSEMENIISINLSDIKGIDVSEEDENLKEFGDLECVVCRAMVFAANNRLVECADCHSLYHQECHNPPIADDANEHELSWCCTNCKNKSIMNKTIVISPENSPSKSSNSSSSSSSSSNKSHYSNKKNIDNIKIKSSSSTQNVHSSSKKHLLTTTTSSSSHTSTTVITSSNSSTKHSPITPTINIVSADRRLQIMKKKAAKQHETKRKHK